MILALLLLASLAQAQEISTAPAATMTYDVEIQNIGKAVRELQGGRPQITGIPTFRNGVVFENAAGSALTFRDNTTQNTAPVSTADVSSFTRVPATVITNSNFSVCVVTVTLTVAAVPLEFWVAGAALNASVQGSAWTVLVDGAYYPGNSSPAMWAHENANGGYCQKASGTFTIKALTAGSHDFCLAMAVQSAGNFNFANGTCGGITVHTQFGVREAH